MKVILIGFGCLLAVVTARPEPGSIPESYPEGTIALPRIEFPKISIPKIPEIQLPQIPNIPIPEIPDIPTPEIVIPQIRIPDIPVPEVNIPPIPNIQLHIPQIPTPEVNIPDLPNLKFHIPDITIPKINIPEIPVPEFHIPDIKFPDVHIPDIVIPDIPTFPESEHQGIPRYRNRYYSNIGFGGQNYGNLSPFRQYNNMQGNYGGYANDVGIGGYRNSLFAGYNGNAIERNAGYGRNRGNSVYDF